MTLKEAIEVLKQHNNWRRGIEIDMPYLPSQIGEAIDTVVKAYTVTDEEVIIYFNNHSNCYSNDSRINIPAMTRGAVLEFANWMRDRMIGGSK